MDITDTLAPNSDQIDAIDLHHSGPRTFTVERVVVSKADQPVSVHLRGFDRVYRPSKNMRRALADCWGLDSAQWVGRSLTLYCDPEVTFGRDKTGGVRISHASHIDGPVRVPIILTRGKSGIWVVNPLPDAPAAPAAPEPPTAEQVAAATDLDVLAGWARDFHHIAPLVQAVTARADVLKAEAGA